MKKTVYAVLLALLLPLVLVTSCAAPAYADETVPETTEEAPTDVAGNPAVTDASIRELYGIDAAEQTSNATLVRITSKDEQLAGCHIRAYKLISAETGTSNQMFDDWTAIYADGVNGEMLVPDHDPSGVPTLGIILGNKNIVENSGSSDIKWEYLKNLTAQVTALSLPYTTVIVDGEPTSLPGSGVYLFVLEGYEQIDIDNNHITSPFFTECVYPAERTERTYRNGGTEYETVEYINEFSIGVKDYEGRDSMWLAKMVRGEEGPSKRAILTEIYQPENIPADVIEARAAAEAAEQAEIEEQSGGLSISFSLLPIVIVIAAVIVLNVVMKRRKKQNAATIPTTAKEGATIDESAETTGNATATSSSATDERNASPFSDNKEEVKPLAGAGGRNE